MAPVLLVRPWPSACGTVTFQSGQGSGATALLPRPQPDARVQALPHRHGRPQPGPGLDAQAAPLCVYYAPCSVCFFTKTLTVRAVSHCLKITSLHPHALAGINLVLTCGSSAFQKANKSRGDRDLRIPFVPCPRRPRSGERPQALRLQPPPWRRQPAAGGPAHVSKTLLPSTASTRGIFDTRVEPGGFPSVTLSCPPRPLEGHSPAAGAGGPRQPCPWLLVLCRGRGQSGGFSQGAKEPDSDAAHAPSFPCATRYRLSHKGQPPGCDEKGWHLGGPPVFAPELLGFGREPGPGVVHGVT